MRNGEKFIIKPGESMVVYPGEIHCFFNPTDRRIKFKGMIKPGSMPFEDSLRILYGLARDKKTNEESVPKNPFALAVILATSDVHLPKNTVLGKLEPLFNLLYKIAQWTGVERRLYNKYVYSPA